MTVEEYKKEVRMKNAERIGVSIDIFNKRVDLINNIIAYSDQYQSKEFIDWSNTGERNLYPDQLSL